MKCENCEKDHDGTYGSGRFCSNKCAKGFSTKAKRSSINEKISSKMKGRTSNHGFQKGNDPRRRTFSSESAKVANVARAKKRQEWLSGLTWIELPRDEKRKIIFVEQKEQCFECGLSEWLGNPITLELEHVDGNNTNDERSNLKLLCPNCHSYTPTWRRKKSSMRC